MTGDDMFIFFSTLLKYIQLKKKKITGDGYIHPHLKYIFTSKKEITQIAGDGYILFFPNSNISNSKIHSPPTFSPKNTGHMSNNKCLTHVSHNADLEIQNRIGRLMWGGFE